jgi:hypothetical protein
MASNDLEARFDQLSDTARAAADELKAAGQTTKDQLEAEVASARNTAALAAQRLKDAATDATNLASSQWDDIRSRWQTHVNQMRADVDAKIEKFDTHLVTKRAGQAQSYALDAIDFAQAAIEEAQYAVLNALSARAKADELDES